MMLSREMFGSKKVVYMAVISLVVIFIIDLITPASYLVDIVYLASMFLVSQQDIKIITVFAVAVCCLICLSLVITSFQNHLTLSNCFNRFISILAVVMTALIARYYRIVNQSLLIKEKKHLLAMQRMIFLTSHQMRKPVANIIGLTRSLDIEKEHLNVNEVKQYCIHLQSSAVELDQVVAELNQFLKQNIETDNAA